VEPGFMAVELIIGKIYMLPWRKRGRIGIAIVLNVGQL
jgi:hypothetical protein